jgi:hypothetical protein
MNTIPGLPGNNRAHSSNVVAISSPTIKVTSSYNLAASQPLLDGNDGILDGTRNEELVNFLSTCSEVLSDALYNRNQRAGNGLLPRLPIDREELPLKRSLIAQIRRLKTSGRLVPLLHSPVVRVASTRFLPLIVKSSASKDAEEVTAITSRTEDFAQRFDSSGSQIDFDNEVALIIQRCEQPAAQHDGERRRSAASTNCPPR